MRVSMKWLNELVDTGMAPVDLAERLDMTGTAVEAIESAGAALDGVVVGRIVEKERHPDADKLWVTKVDVGEGEMRTIVCGAQNFEAGDVVPVALPGAVLPGGFEIKKSKLRGVVSEGMNCSERELGLGEGHEGIMLLPREAVPGTPFSEYAGTGDTILDLEITPNRPDCLSMAGVAREVGAILGKPYTMPSSEAQESGEPADALASVRIDDGELCNRYVAKVICGVKIGPSPSWLAEKVSAAGARPINNVVDVTNYVMFELGQPLHAFDMDTLGKDEQGRASIIVRNAQAGERLKTLDDVDRDLLPDTLAICDPAGPVALAGVMGGEHTEVSDSSVNILLESACFKPQSISKTSRSLGLVSEASMRFEREVDRAGCLDAANRAAALIAQVAGGTVATGAVDAYPKPPQPLEITLRSERLAYVVGEVIPEDEAAGILTALGCSVKAVSGGLAVVVPTYRPDLTREIDLVEEVLRVHGMESVTSTLPAGRGRIGGLTPEQKKRDIVGRTMRCAGLNETMTYAFAGADDLEKLGMSLGEDEVTVELMNPMSTDQAVLRRTILGGLLRSVAYNQSRGVANVHLYEIGTVFTTSAGRKQPKERQMLAAVMTGSWGETGWNDPAVPLDFFDGKGTLELLARELAVKRFKVRASEAAWLQPGRAADVLVGGDVIGWLGELHPQALQRFEAEAPVVAFEIDLARLIRASQDARQFVEPPRFPAVERDLALVVPEAVTSSEVEQAMRSAGGKLLDEIRLFDVYKGKGIAGNSKSLAFSLSYRAPDRTLTAEEVDKTHDKLVDKVVSTTGGQVRG